MTGYTLEVTARSILRPSISRQSLKANMCNLEEGFKTPFQRTCQQPHSRPLRGHVRLPARSGWDATVWARFTALALQARKYIWTRAVCQQYYYLLIIIINYEMRYAYYYEVCI